MAKALSTALLEDGNESIRSIAATALQSWGTKEEPSRTQENPQGSQSGHSLRRATGHRSDRPLGEGSETGQA